MIKNETFEVPKLCPYFGIKKKARQLTIVMRAASGKLKAVLGGLDWSRNFI